jgi:putative zinc finger/helix-turn-helix YgiT family protein
MVPEEKICPQCDKKTIFVTLEREEDYEVRGELIKVVTPVLSCPECGLEFFDEELTGAALRKAYDEYRKRRNIPVPEEIKTIRRVYDLSQRGFAKMLGWGYVTVNRYENGALPNDSHTTILITLKKDPKYALALLEANNDNFSSTTKGRFSITY